LRNSQLLLLVATLASGATLARDPLYVQSEQAQLRVEANAQSTSLATLKRAETVAPLNEKGMWVQVAWKNKQGWINRLFLSPNPPIGQNALLQDTDETLQKSARKRAPAYSVAASARGLMADERKRVGQDKYQADYEALEEMEKRAPAAADVQAFRAEAHLGGGR
jgi:beta-barrel assembly-enhancing protease